ncbi:hypothetical protein HEP81_04586 [Streptomyces griseofuscus]|uniref:Helix-turn-helix domain-containing protein n=1 Tax=Streptomyces griseofuscus TaxID=146922 RepID=A0A7H1Q3H9_9ACTN|nr:hypothetical protein [Streptomyces griseofuscus]QNT94859.1 hypothetical protein HEP81_04586 [Streptomyces griseofuscus]
MSAEEPEGRTGGGPAHSFGNALAWKWSREMPRSLKGGFLTLLYALRAMASANGYLRFRDGKVIRIQDIAKAAGCREQDARRYLEAAIRAGVVVVEGERRRGTATLYVIANTNWPDWKAAEAYLKGTARRRKEDEEVNDGSGHSGTNLEGEGSGHGGTNQFGPQRSELGSDDAESVRSTVDRPGSVHSGTTGSGHSGTNIPGGTQGVPHDMADVVPQPQVDAGADEETDQPSPQHEEHLPYGRCEVCTTPLTRPGKPRCSVHSEPLPGQRRRGSSSRQRAIQPPLLASVPPASDRPAGPARPPFQWKPEDPLAPARICGCGREFKARTDQTCQDCQFAAHQEAETA